MSEQQPGKNPHLKIVPKEPSNPEELRRQMQQESETEMGPTFRITPYNIDNITFDDNPETDNAIKITTLERMLVNEGFDGPEEHDIAKKLIELKNRKF